MNPHLKLYLMYAISVPLIGFMAGHELNKYIKTKDPLSLQWSLALLGLLITCSVGVPIALALWILL